MDYAYHFGDPGRLYLNVTNRCTNRCSFCVRNGRTGIGDGWLWGGPEPGLEALLGAIDAQSGPGLREVIWCGFGEPTFRLDLITAAAAPLRARGLRIRCNTNGHARLIHGRDVLDELAAVIDDVSVSLNAPTRERYIELCRPDARSLPASPELPPGAFWDATLDFLARAPRRFRWAQASVVGSVLTEGEIAAARALAASLGVEAFRVR